MKSQTARRPDNKRPARSTQARKYTKQTAHVEARRDGKPLIFGWGGHLSRTDKTRIQQRAVWSAIILTVLLIAIVIAGFWVNNNVVIPNQAITSVNGQSITQADYHKLVALKAQIELNKIKGAHGLYASGDSLTKQASDQQKVITSTNTDITNLNKQIKALPAGSGTQSTDLQNQLKAAQTKHDAAQKQHDALELQYQTLQQTTIPNEQVFYTQDQIGNDSATWLQDNIFITNWLNKQSSSIQNQINPSDAAINNALNEFKANLPKDRNYSQFLSNGNVSDSDVHSMLGLILRRDNMQTYQAAQITSPSKQVRVRGITLSTTGDANNIINQLKNGAKFADLAKSKSVDTNTKSKGGEIGWLAAGQYTKQISQMIAGSGSIDNWLFNPARKANDLSPVLTESGTYHVLQIEEIDPSRAIDSKTLTELRGMTKSDSVVGNNITQTALQTWLLLQRAQPSVHVGTVDTTMLTDPMNMPADVPASAPSTPGAAPSTGTGTGTGSGAPATGSGATTP